MACQRKTEQRIELSGKWNFAMDSSDIGEIEHWYIKELTNDIITLPGSMAEHNKGYEITANTKWTANIWSDSSWFKRPDFAKYRKKGQVKVPFWLSPPKVYAGVAWYQRQIDIPGSWGKRQVTLYLERCHWESKVWIDSMAVGMRNSLSTPHTYDLSAVLTPGKHTITIKVDNRIKDINPGLDAHSVSDNTQTNWNGIVGEIALVAKSKLNIASVMVTPNVTNKLATVELEIENAYDESKEYDIKLSASSFNSSIRHSTEEVMQFLNLKPGTTNISVELPMGDNFLTWDEFNPNLYKLEVELNGCVSTTIFGMREIAVQGKGFTINDKPIFLRGTLECSIFPLTGYPACDVAWWKNALGQAQKHGLNHIRFHSWCPPEAAFTAADELGMYFQVEAATWGYIGNDAPIDKYIYEESERIVKAYGNHPSFCLMAYGNEPHGPNRNKFLKGFVGHWQEKDSRFVYTSGAGWPRLEENDYHNVPAPRLQQWAQGLKSIINAKAPNTAFNYSKIIDKSKKPIVSHEIGQWCVFPNFDEIEKYTGVMKAKNFELFQEDLKDHSMLDQAKDFFMASGKLQALCYKTEIEAALRTKGMAGFQLLDLHDFPGQGTALVGVLDAFWDEKGYVSPEEFREFCNEVVPLAKMDKMVYSTSDTLKAQFEVANFSGKVLKNKQINWQLFDGNNISIKGGVTQVKDFAIGNALYAGEVNLSLEKLVAPAKYTLKIGLEGTAYRNQWDIWLYPETLPENTGDVLIVEKLSDVAIQALKDGGKVLLNIRKEDLKAEKGGDIALGFSSVFWNTSWTKNQAPHTLGVLTQPNHAALADFPTEYHSNYQWWDIMTHSAALNIDHFPANYKPVIQPIHTWFKNNKLALVIEANVLNGKLLMTSVDLKTDIQKRLPSRQLKYSLLNYMNGESFNPILSLEVDEVKDFFVER